MSDPASSSPQAAGSAPSAAAFLPATPSVLRLAWRAALRDLRAGELRLLLVAVGLAVAALTAVGFFADRLDRKSVV